MGPKILQNLDRGVQICHDSYLCLSEGKELGGVLRTKGETLFIGKCVANVYWSIVVFILFIMTFIPYILILLQEFYDFLPFEKRKA